MSVWKGLLSVVNDTINTILSYKVPGVQRGTYSYIDAGGEQTVDILATADRHYIKSIWLDLINMTQDGNIKLYYKIDGTTFREFASYDFTVLTDSDGVLIDCGFGIEANLKITYEEGADEGAARDIPYEIDYDKEE